MVQTGVSWSENLQGGVAIAGAMLAPFLRQRRRRWGATDDELERTYPGDSLIPDPKWTAVHAISIEATPESIWPWIAQIGQGRGGFYSYQKLENAVGSSIENTSRILEEHQSVRAGDPIRLHLETPPMTVAIAEEPTALVLLGEPAGAGDGVAVTTSWAFLLLEQPDGTTRLISRTRYSHGPDLRSRLMGGQLLIEPVSYVMERKMLRVIKELVEST